MESKQVHWLVRPTTIRRLSIISLIVLALTVAPDFFLPSYGHFGIDGTFGFYAWYGFITCALMVFVAKLLGLFIKRKDDYYHND